MGLYGLCFSGSVSSWASLKQAMEAPWMSSHSDKLGSSKGSYLNSQKYAHLIVYCSGSSNGSVFAPQSDSYSDDHPHQGVADASSKPGRRLKNTPGPVTKQKSKPGPITKQIIENFIDKSRESLEGVQQPQQHLTEQGQDKSLTSLEGSPNGENGAASSTNKPSTQEEASTSLSETDSSFWRSVFPAYMRSKDEEEQIPSSADEDVNGSAKGLGVRGAAAARAAAAAAASAKELESHVNSIPKPALIPSTLAPPCSISPSPSGGKKLEDLISDDPIWAAIRAEARLEAEREPLLSSFLYASILAHPCFERSLGFVLANRLKNTTLLATQLMDVFDDVFTKDANIRQAVRLDVEAVKDRDPSCRSYSSALLYLKGYHALQSYRVAHVLWNRGQMVLALALQSRISEVFAVDIHPAARIGKAILLDHGTGVVIGETAVIGDRVSMLQGVTLGGTGKIAGDRHPKIGEGVLIGAGATILGNIKVGRGAMVAAGSLVLKDVPPHSMVAGTPARVVGVLEEPTPALTMKHDVSKDLWQSMGDDSVCGGTGI